MVSPRTIAAAALVALLIIAVALAARAREGLLGGLWVGDPSFLASADLSAFYLYIGPPSAGPLRPRHRGYLVMVGADGGVISNQDIDLKYGGAWRRGASALGGLLLPGGGTYRLQDVAVAYGDAPAMPETVSLAVDPRAGSLTVHRDGEVYAFLYRDNEASAAADAQYRAGGA